MYSKSGKTSQRAWQSKTGLTDDVHFGQDCLFLDQIRI